MQSSDQFYYLIILSDKNKLNEAVVNKHVAHLKTLNQAGSLVLCGPFQEGNITGNGMVLVRAKDLQQATEIAQRDPFVAEGYKTFKISTLIVADESNNYLI